MKKTLKKIFSIISIMLCVSVLLTACGGGGEESNTDDDQPINNFGFVIDNDNTNVGSNNSGYSNNNTHYEVSHLFTEINEGDIPGDWQYYFSGTICSFYEDGSYEIETPNALYGGTYNYEDGILKFNDGDYGYFEDDGGIFLRLSWMDEYFFKIDSAPTQGGHTTGIVGEWFDENYGISLSFYDDDSYSISSMSGAALEVPAMGEYFHDYSDIYFFEFNVDHGYDPSYAVGNIKLVIDGADFGKITLEGTDYMFTKLSNTPSGGDSGGNGSSGSSNISGATYYVNDNSQFGYSNVPLASGTNGEVYYLESGGAYQNSYEYATFTTEHALTILDDRVNGDIRTVSFELLTSILYSEIPENYDDYNFSYNDIMYDYQAGFFLPVNPNFLTSLKDNRATFEYSIMGVEDDAYVDVTRTDSFNYHIGDYYGIATTVFTVSMEADYPGIVVGIHPKEPTLTEELAARDLKDSYEYVGWHENSYGGDFNGLYWKIP